MSIPESKIVKVIFRTVEGKQGVTHGVLNDNGGIKCQVPRGAQVVGTQRHNERLIRLARVDKRERGAGKLLGITKPNGLINKKKFN